MKTKVIALTSYPCSVATGVMAHFGYDRAAGILYTSKAFFNFLASLTEQERLNFESSLQ